MLTIALEEHNKLSEIVNSCSLFIWPSIYSEDKTRRLWCRTFRKEIIDDYDLSPSAFDKWVRQHSQSGSFKEKDNLTPEQQELRELRKENTQLKMENDILKQAALIFGRK